MTVPPEATAIVGSRSELRFFDETSNRDVVLEIEDRSGLLISASGGRVDVSWPHVQNERGDAAVANDPSDPRVVRVDWFAPGGCDDSYGFLIGESARSMTIATSYVVGGDSIGGNCVVTLRFSVAIPAAEIDVNLANTAPAPGADSLGKDARARVVATDGLRVRSAPGLGSDSERLEPLLPEGLDLLIVDGPIEADGYAWYLAQPYASQTAYPFGWVAAASRDDVPWVRPQEGGCPDPTMTDEEIAAVDPLEALACFGRADVVVVGALSCSGADVDYRISGPAWLDGRYLCTFDPDAGSAIQVFGSPVTRLVDANDGQPVRGDYRVRGHHADAASSGCTGLGISDAEAVVFCRSRMVATEVALAD